MRQLRLWTACASSIPDGRGIPFWAFAGAWFQILQEFLDDSKAVWKAPPRWPRIVHKITTIPGPALRMHSRIYSSSAFKTGGTVFCRCVRVLVWGAALSLTLPVAALNPARNIDQYFHESWNSQRGLPGEAVYQILQSQDGYIWLRTSAGLARFDGVRFVAMDDALGHEPVKAIAMGADGDLLIRTTSKTVAYKHGKFVDYLPAKPLPDGEIREMYETSRHEVLIGSDNFIYGVTRAGIRTLRSNTAWINSILEDSSHNTWIGGNYNLYSFRDGKLALAASLGKYENIFALAEDRAHTIWLGTPHGLLRLHQNPISLEPYGQGILRSGINQVFADEQNNLWLGTSSSGLVRVTAGRVSSFMATDGLSDNGVLAIFEDREGSLWVGTASGLDRFRDTKFTTLTVKEGLPSNDASTAIAARDGSIWVLCSYGGLAHIRGGKVVSVLTKIPGLPSIHGATLYEDKTGAVWMGAFGALTRIDNDKVTVYNADPRLSKEYISSISEDDEGLILGTSGMAMRRFKQGKTYPFLVRGKVTPLTAPGNYVFTTYRQPSGTIWFGTVKGLFLYRPGTIPVRQAGIDFPVTTISDDARGNLWLGGRIPGITRFRIRDGQVVRYLKSSGLFNTYSYRVLPDPLGNLWMGTADGIYEAKAKDLDDFANGIISTVPATRFDATDGMKTSEANYGALGSGGCMGQNGILWFTTTDGLVQIDSLHIPQNKLIPPVIIESVIADDLQFNADRDVLIPPGKDKIELHYTALSLRIPARVQFKYMLKGYDRDWVNAGVRRVAYYNNLPPGTYTFLVMAQNDDGLWNVDGAAINFRVKPRYYQTRWFIGLCVLLAAALAFLIIRLNNRRLRSRATELERLVTERTKSLRLEVRDRQRAEEAAIDAREKMRFQATHDPLTSFLNRGAILEMLDRELARSSREHTPIAVLMADLDHFKDVNDKYGHLAGDQVLRDVGDRLLQSVRPYDLIGRYGGEEFLIVFPNCMASDARDRAEELRRIVRDRPITTSDGAISISMSIGVVSIVHNRPTCMEPDEILREADAALYAAKHGGRDRCITVSA